MAEKTDTPAEETKDEPSKAPKPKAKTKKSSKAKEPERFSAAANLKRRQQTSK